MHKAPPKQPLTSKALFSGTSAKVRSLSLVSRYCIHSACGALDDCVVFATAHVCAMEGLNFSNYVNDKYSVSTQAIIAARSY
eukprot:6489735-Amphidinium_carterae.4